MILWIELILYFVVGVLPCIIWLLFYLRQDVHPEPNRKVIEIFFLGALMVLPVLLLENKLGSFLGQKLPALFDVGSPSTNITQLLFYYVIIIGFVEEFFKYLVVKMRAIKSSHFDEPIDAMLYLIIASLGLAAVENIAAILGSGGLGNAVLTSLMRLLTAIFLHTLAAGITGFFLALSLNAKKIKSFLLISSGLLVSSIFHGLYDVSIVKLEHAKNIFDFLLPIGIIMLMGIIVYFLFLKVKKMPRSCKA